MLLLRLLLLQSITGGQEVVAAAVVVIGRIGRHHHRAVGAIVVVGGGADLVVHSMRRRRIRKGHTVATTTTAGSRCWWWRSRTATCSYCTGGSLMRNGHTVLYILCSTENCALLLAAVLVCRKSGWEAGRGCDISLSLLKALRATMAKTDGLMTVVVVAVSSKREQLDSKAFVSSPCTAVVVVDSLVGSDCYCSTVVVAAATFVDIVET